MLYKIFYPTHKKVGIHKTSTNIKIISLSREKLCENWFRFPTFPIGFVKIIPFTFTNFLKPCDIMLLAITLLILVNWTTKITIIIQLVTDMRNKF